MVSKAEVTTEQTCILPQTVGTALTQGARAKPAGAQPELPFHVTDFTSARAVAPCPFPRGHTEAQQ